MGVSETLLNAVDDEVRRIVEECYAEACRLLGEHRAQLDALVAALLAKESLDEPEIYAIAGIAHPAPAQGAPAPTGVASPSAT
jgi:cell division protease FtsH